MFVSHNIKNNKYDNNIYSTFSVNQIKSDGQEIYDDIYSFFDHNTVSISSRLDASDKLSMAIRTTYDKRYFNSQYYYTRSPYDLSNETVEKYWTQAKLNYNINNNQKIDFNFSYQSVDDVYVFNPAFPNYENQTNLGHGRFSYLIKLKKSIFTFGLDWQKRKMESIDRGDHEDNYFGGFVNYITSFGDLNFNPSFRLDYNQHYGLQFCPQFDINYNNEAINVRASAGKTIRSADFTERFYNNNYSGPLSSGRNIGNPKLNAEKTLNYEIGIDYVKSRFIKFNNTVFYRNSSDLIDWVLTPSQSIPIDIELINNESYFFAQNISELFTLGMESELWFQLSNKNNIRIFGSIGYLKIFQAESPSKLFTEDENLILSKYLANNSGDKFNYNLSIDLNNVILNFSGIYKARDKEVDLSLGQTLEEDYFVHNSEITLCLTKKISTSIELMNIFNKHYSDFMGAIMPKRWLIFGLELKL